MKNFILMIFGFLFICVVFTSTARAEYKEGKWSMTMVTKMDNMPPEMAAAMQQMQNMPPEVKAQMEKAYQRAGVSMNMSDGGMTVTAIECLTKHNPVPSKMSAQSGCQETHEIDGDTVKFHATCDRNDYQMESTGTMTYSGDTMQGHITSHQMRAGKTIDSTIDMTGQYLGPC